MEAAPFVPEKAKNERCAAVHANVIFYYTPKTSIEKEEIFFKATECL
jgi:hypothetical protein